MAMSVQGAHCPSDIMLMGVRWSGAYPWSMRHVEALLLERGIHVEHATITRWVGQYSPQREDALQRRQGPVGVSWRLDAPYMQGKGQWYER